MLANNTYIKNTGSVIWNMVFKKNIQNYAVYIIFEDSSSFKLHSILIKIFQFHRG
jgi:hypothetical protein